MSNKTIGELIDESCINPSVAEIKAAIGRGVSGTMLWTLHDARVHRYGPLPSDVHHAIIDALIALTRTSA